MVDLYTQNNCRGPQRPRARSSKMTLTRKRVWFKPVWKLSSSVKLFKRERRLEFCGITGEGCAALASALKSNPSSNLKELNLKYNKPGESGLKLLSDLLEDPHCKLEKLHNDPLSS
ncbi:hypothetical protein AOLI_G00152550 [Acnodon oligacanthus]